MELWEIIKLILMPILFLYVTYNERDKLMIKKNQEAIKDKGHELEANVRVLQSQEDDIKNDLHRIEGKLDKLLDKLVSKKL